jgi:hypothetical protein
MTKLDKLPSLIDQFVSDPAARAGAEAAIRKWIADQASMIRDLGPVRRLRCFALVTTARTSPHLISVEFAAPDDSAHTLVIHTDGRHDVRGQQPHTVDLAAGIKLLALLADELGVPVRLQP